MRAGKALGSFNLIVAMTRKGVIGRKIPQTQPYAGLPWHQAADMGRFRNLTYGCPCIMGRNTYEHIGRPLTGRLNVVVSKTLPPQDDLVVARNFPAAYDLVKRLRLEHFVIGGAKIYQQALSRNLVDKLYVTWIEADVDGDVMFPKWDPKSWFEQIVGNGDVDKDNDHPYQFCVYHREKPSG